MDPHQNTPHDGTRNLLKQRILDTAYIEATKTPDLILSPDGTQPAWFFDFRKILFEQQVLLAIGVHFWEVIGRARQIQIGGLETASLPIIAACVLAGDGASTGFYIRKSRKKKMQMRQIEGTLSDADVVLVDDLINSGSTFKMQIEVLEREGKRVSDIFVLVRFRDMSAYTYFTERGIRIHALFTLDDLGIVPVSDPPLPPDPLERLWYFGPARPHVFDVRPKPQPIMSDGVFITTSDSGYVWCLDTETGKERWSKRIALKVRPATSTFVSSALHGEDVFVGLTNGMIARLAVRNGALRCVDSVAEQITSGLTMAPSVSLVVCGIGGGGSPKQYAVAAFDAATLEKRWEYRTQAQVRAQPLLVGSVVVLGDVVGNLVALDIATGAPQWSCAVGSGIMSSPALYHDAVVFGTEDGVLHTVDVLHGTETARLAVGEWLYATPFVADGRAYVSALDSWVYCVDLVRGTILWKFETKGRIFAAPVVREGMVYVGNNEGKLYMLDAETGKLRGMHMVTERITNPAMIAGDKVFITTLANETYCLKVR